MCNTLGGATTVRGHMLRVGLLLLVLCALACQACGSRSATQQPSGTVSGRVPAVCLPVPDGRVRIDIVPVASGPAHPVASTVTSTLVDGYFSLVLPPGRYRALISGRSGRGAFSRPFEVSARGSVKAEFLQP